MAEHRLSWRMKALVPSLNFMNIRKGQPHKINPTNHFTYLATVLKSAALNTHRTPSLRDLNPEQEQLLEQELEKLEQDPTSFPQLIQRYETLLYTDT
jgi:hypothetical protein